MSDVSIVLANEFFQKPNGKTAHGLVRYSSRFMIAAVVDPQCAGRDAGEVLDGKKRGIPVVGSVVEALQSAKSRSLKPKYCIIGVATPGGVIPPNLKKEILTAIDNKLEMVNGLHNFLSNDPAIAKKAKAKKVKLHDIRRPNPKLHFWQGTIFSVKAPRLAVLGTDCAIGKRTTTVFLLEALKNAGVKAEMIYTGQTGWMQGIKHGIIFDAIPNDFISGEVENAIVECDKDLKPDLILIEGQSALQNPSGPCGSEFLKSAQAKGVILHHSPGRKYFHGTDEFRCEIPTPEAEIELIKMYGSRVLAVTLNEEHMGDAEMEAYRRGLEARIGIPVVRPLKEGVGRLVPVVREYLQANVPAIA